MNTLIRQICKIVAVITVLAAPLSAQVDPALVENINLEKLTNIEVKESGGDLIATLRISYTNENAFQVGIKEDSFDVTIGSMMVGAGQFLGKNADDLLKLSSTKGSSTTPVYLYVEVALGAKNDPRTINKLVHIINTTGPGTSPIVALKGTGIFGMQFMRSGTSVERGWVYTDMIEVDFIFGLQIQDDIPIE